MRSISPQERNRAERSDLGRGTIKKRQKIRFPVVLSDSLMQADLEELELSVRSMNCLRRAGYQTIGQLVTAISGSDDLRRIRNCGQKSICEIMTGLLLYQYSKLPPEKRKAYIRQIAALSTSPASADPEGEGGAENV